MDACRKGIPNGVSPFGLLRSPQTGDCLLCEHWACRELIGCAVGCLDRQRFHAGGHQLHRNGHQQSVRDHRRAGRRLVVHELREQLHRAHHDGRGRHQLHRNGHQRSVRDHRRAGRRLVVHERYETTPSGASRRQGPSPTTPERASAVRTGSPPGRTAPCGSRTSRTTPSGASRRQGSSPTTPERASAVRTGSRPGRTAPCGSPTSETTPSGASRREGPSPTTPERASAIRTGSRPGRTAPCGSRTRTTTPSGASRREGPSPTTPERASAIRTGSPPGRTAPCGSRTTGNNSIGRITTGGVVTNYTGTGISGPTGITAGPDGALWFTNYREQLHRAHHHRVLPSPNDERSHPFEWGDAVRIDHP